MHTLTLKAYAKINLALDVIGKRHDGYHELKMIMQSIDLADTLTFDKIDRPSQSIAPAPYIQLEIIQLHMGTLPQPILPTDETNLAHRTATAILSSFRPDASVKITLTKNIPIAAGLGGGSSDAAAVFHGLNTLFDLNISTALMNEKGARIGADIPFCLLGGTALATGIGEKLKPLPSPPPCHILLVKPDIEISTKDIFAKLNLLSITHRPDIDCIATAITASDLDGITARMGNVLETVTIREYPIIGEIKSRLIKQGAKNAMMSGSGPTVFAIFADEKKMEEAHENMSKNYATWKTRWQNAN